ncbi:hypothetical protein HYW94_00340 [Candidatus Uhrbacteria bacterium]|nr:hypothetical protein [Candidatus Uhrbacteria bacterium]
MKGIILTVQYKTYADIALIPEFPYEERFLVTIADVCKNREGESVFTKTYLWKIIEINGVPTAKDAVEGLPTFKSIENQEIWDAFKLFLIADDGMLRSYSELMKLST